MFATTAAIDRRELADRLCGIGEAHRRHDGTPAGWAEKAGGAFLLDGMYCHDASCASAGAKDRLDECREMQ